MSRLSLAELRVSQAGTNRILRVLICHTEHADDTRSESSQRDESQAESEGRRRHGLEAMDTQRLTRIQ